MNFEELNFGDSEPVGNTSDNYVMSDPYTSYGYKGESSGIFDSLSGLLGGAKNVLSGGSGSMAQLAGLGGLGALINKFGGSGSSGPTGYQGAIPKYTASRSQLPIPRSTSQSAYPQMRPNMMAGLNRPGMMGSRPAQAMSQYSMPQRMAPRRPGSGGVSYFSPMQYLKPGESPAMTNSRPTAQPPTQSYAPAPFERDPIPSWMSSPAVQKALTSQAATGNNGENGGPISSSLSRAGAYQPPVISSNVDEDVRLAGGGIASLGGYSDGGRLLRGPGDGVSDSIPATIGNNQPARLADGEFVIPARIVSEIGNGSTEAGARKLYAMMERIQKARSKTLKNVAANTKADKHLPA